MNTSTATSPRTALRTATAADHGRVDRLFGDGLRLPGDYLTYLRGMQALLDNLDRGLAAASKVSPAWRAWRHPERAAWLRRDFDHLGIDAMAAGPALRIDDDDAAAGALYVVEGSALGARVLLADAARLGHGDGRGATFLHRHAGRAATSRWREFVACLEQASFAAVQERRMLAAATAAFASAEQEFRRARRLQRKHEHKHDPDTFDDA